MGPWKTVTLMFYARTMPCILISARLRVFTTTTLTDKMSYGFRPFPKGVAIICRLMNTRTRPVKFCWILSPKDTRCIFCGQGPVVWLLSVEDQWSVFCQLMTNDLSSVGRGPVVCLLSPEDQWSVYCRPRTSDLSSVAWGPMVRLLSTDDQWSVFCRSRLTFVKMPSPDFSLPSPQPIPKFSQHESGKPLSGRLPLPAQSV